MNTTELETLVSLLEKFRDYEDERFAASITRAPSIGLAAKIEQKARDDLGNIDFVKRWAFARLRASPPSEGLSVTISPNGRRVPCPAGPVPT